MPGLFSTLWIAQNPLCPPTAVFRLFLAPSAGLEVIHAADPAGYLGAAAELPPNNISCKGFVKLCPCICKHAAGLGYRDTQDLAIYSQQRRASWPTINDLSNAYISFISAWSLV